MLRLFFIYFLCRTQVKIVPKPDIALSRSKAKVVRKQLLHQVQDKISQSDFFKIEEEPVVWDEYRYMELLIRYPQHFNQAPCLRPFNELLTAKATSF